MSDSPIIRTEFYNLNGDPCRLDRHENGDQTADIYRAGRGILPINPNDLFHSAKEIDSDSYQDLVREKIALHEREALDPNE
jgi:hypothetical protein